MFKSHHIILPLIKPSLSLACGSLEQLRSDCERGQACSCQVLRSLVRVILCLAIPSIRCIARSVRHFTRPDLWRRCGHCKRLAPVWDELAESIAADPKLASRVVIAKVDADADRDLGNRFGITGFPTLQFFARGKPVDEPTKCVGPCGAACWARDAVRVLLHS